MAVEFGACVRGVRCGLGALWKSEGVLQCQPLHRPRDLTPVAKRRALWLTPEPASECFVRIIDPRPSCATVLALGDAARELASIQGGELVTMSILPCGAWAEEPRVIATGVLGIKQWMAS